MNVTQLQSEGKLHLNEFYLLYENSVGETRVVIYFPERKYAYFPNSGKYRKCGNSYKISNYRMLEVDQIMY